MHATLKFLIDARRSFLLLIMLWAPAIAAQSNYLVLSYHDIVANVREHRDPDSIDVEQLAQQFAWLRGHGYVAISVSDIIAAQSGGKPLPEKAVLLTFDDGYRSVYTKVFPLLKLYNYPAVVAVVGSWLETAPDQTIDYGDIKLPRDNFVSWVELKEMADSGLVEVASHSYDLHRGVVANPQNNTQPAATTRRYDPASGRYESDADYGKRIRADLERSASAIGRQMGKPPRAMVWPYGAYSMETNAIARAAGMPITFNLEDGLNPATFPLDRIRRTLLRYISDLGDFVSLITPPQRPPTQRIVHVDIDYIYDPDPAQQEKNLGLLLDRIKALGVNTVYLQAYADPDGDGAADALYFPNRHLPMRADLFNRVAWQLRTRTGARVYAWMPLLAFELPASHPVAAHRVVTADGGSPGYPRLSPFDAEARRVIKEIYEDLAKSAPIAGLLFHDDATLSDFEDASPAALQVYARDWQLSGSIQAIRADAKAMKIWTDKKTAALTAFSLELAGVVRRYQPDIRTARNLYAATVMTPESQEWFAQTLPDFLAAYDYAALMAMPYMENAADPQLWLDTLFDRVAAIPGALDKTVFELQARDWRNNQPVASTVLARQIRALRLRGAHHIGYYPDDFLVDQPAITLIQPAMSQQSELE
jgi:biofilm PGA synthesis lipoprotein PgaB